MEEIDIPEGTTPERELFRTSRTFNCKISARLAGIRPVKPLKLKSSLVSIPKFPKLAGISSISLLSCKARTFNLFKEPICVGIFPVSWLQPSCKTTKQRSFFFLIKPSFRTRVLKTVHLQFQSFIDIFVQQHSIPNLIAHSVVAEILERKGSTKRKSRYQL